MDIQYLPRGHPEFPDRLRRMPEPPVGIYVMGAVAALHSTHSLAVVGTRRLSPYGKQITDQLTSQAAERGVTIASGLALGVDAAAHQAALRAQGVTFAVLGSGLDQVTPVTNQWLGRQILEQGGALVSEYPPGSPTHKSNFIARNRLVAALSDAVLITEATISSGTRHTVNFALDQGRTVLAVPGNITAVQSEGTNHFLKIGAQPVTDIRDILHALGLERGQTARRPRGENPAQTCILALLTQGVSDVGELQRSSGLEARVFNQTLTMLEISGKVRAQGGGQWGIVG